MFYVDLFLFILLWFIIGLFYSLILMPINIKVGSWKWYRCCLLGLAAWVTRGGLIFDREGG
jgi:hypothetical protein